MKNKSEVPALFRQFVASVLNETNKTVRTLRSDNGGEYVGHEFKIYLAERGILHETSAAYTPAKNGVSERGNRPLMDGARSLLFASNLPSSLWAEAVAYIVFIRNRLISSTNNVTPYEAWYGRKPNLADIRIFGSRAFVRCPDARKLDQGCEKGAFVGLSDTQKASRIYVASTPPRIVVSHDVKVDETTMYFKASTSEPSFTSDDWTEKTILDHDTREPIADLPVLKTSLQGVMDPTPMDTNNNEAEEILPQETIPHHSEIILPDLPETPNEAAEITTNDGDKVISEDNTTSSPQTGSRRSSRLPAYTERYLEYKRSLANQATVLDVSTQIQTNNTQPTEPSSYTEAISCADAEHWIPAIFDEYESLIQNGTWSLCPLPTGRKAIQGKWILKFKPGYKDVAPRFKARFVSKGYSQIFGLDYIETFSPVVKHYSLRVVLAIAAAKDLEMIQLDIKTAFLYGDLQEEIYMEQPEGFVVPGQEDQVCRLLKSIYGLKQASRAWNKKFHDFILKFGLTQSHADPCVYFRHRREGEVDEEFTVLIIYVDDGIIFSNQKHILTDILEHLKTVFEIRSFPADRFVGVDIIRDRSLRTIHISQPDYISKIVEKFNMVNCNPLAAPADPSCRLSPDMSPQNDEEMADMKNTPYREAVGSLMHVMVMTRPDIAYAVGQVAQYSQKPGQQHWRAVKRILAYLHKTRLLGIRYGGNNTALTGYCDSDYAGDLQTRRSTSGFVFIHLGEPVSWASRRQPCVALSTTEAEFVAASEATKEAVWLKQLLAELGMDHQPTRLYCDNQSAIALVKNPAFHQRTKHIDVRLFHIREVQESGTVNIEYICSEQQLADIFTKPLAIPRFEKLRNDLNIVQIPA